MSHTLAVGDLVQLRTAPANLRHYHLLCGAVRGVEVSDRVVLVDVEFDRPTGDTVLVRDIPVNYLGPAPKDTKAARKGVLNLHEPKDTRTERQIQDDAQAWLTARGYVVLVVGQTRPKIQCTAPGCGMWLWPKGYGNSTGYPDMTVYHPRWKKPGYDRIAPLLLEFKQSEKAERKPRQVELADAGVSAFVWSLSMVVQEIYQHEVGGLGIRAHSDVMDFLATRGLLEAAAL